MAAKVDDCARALLAVGVQKGNHIAILSTPRAEFLLLLLAALRIGAIVVGLNPSHQFDEYDYIIADCTPTLLFAFAKLGNRDYSGTIQELVSKHKCIQQLIVLDDVMIPNSTRFGSFICSGHIVRNLDLQTVVDQVELTDAALLVHTSGTTGYPKGAIITHENLSHCAVIQNILFPIIPLRIICNLPISHTICTCDVVAYALVAGGTIFFQEKFDAADVLTLIERNSITCLIQVSTMFNRIAVQVQKTRRYDTSSLRFLFYLGAPLSPQLLSELKLLCPTVITGWGLTEATSTVTFTSEDDSDHALCHTVGKPAPTYEIRLIDPEGNEVGPGLIGEVLVRGRCVMAGYFKKPDETAKVLSNTGWLHSGDLGKIDEAGRLVLTGRLKCMLKSGGYAVFPREIESVLELHPAVHLAVVTAVPDPVFDEVGCAFLLLKPGCTLDEQDAQAYCRARIANYKIPKMFVVLDQLPMLMNGKIDRRALEDNALDCLALLLMSEINFAECIG